MLLSFPALNATVLWLRYKPLGLMGRLGEVTLLGAGKSCGAVVVVIALFITILQFKICCVSNYFWL